ncbi:MAG: FAD:protein FMN transferase [Angustibacter sp.]
MSTATAGVRTAWVEQIMGMPVSITRRRESGESGEHLADAAVRAVFAELRRVDATFSRWRPDSEVSRVAAGELALSDCSPEVREVHELAEAATRLTSGWFDPWLPTPDGTRRWDPTGLVKGWAVERAAGHLAGTAADWCINAGGDVVLVPSAGREAAVGPERAWLVGIENPRDRGRLVGALSLTCGGAATSGSAARGAHVINPHVGTPADHHGSVTVHGPSLMWADVWATAAYAAGPQAAEVLLAAPGYAAVIVTADGTVTAA